MLEELTGESWEDLLAGYVLTPFGLDSVRVGFPVEAGGAGDGSQPHGHRGAPPALEVQEAGEPSLPGFDIAAQAPAGHLSASVRDLARLASFHLRALRGRDGVLRADTLRTLHAAPPGTESGARVFAAGWVVERTEGGEPLHWTNGSAGTFFAYAGAYPDSDLVIAVVTNIGLAAPPYVEALAEAVHRRVTDEGFDVSWLQRRP